MVHDYTVLVHEWIRREITSRRGQPLSFGRILCQICSAIHSKLAFRVPKEYRTELFSTCITQSQTGLISAEVVRPSFFCTHVDTFIPPTEGAHRYYRATAGVDTGKHLFSEPSILKVTGFPLNSAIGGIHKILSESGNSIESTIALLTGCWL